MHLFGLSNLDTLLSLLLIELTWWCTIFFGEFLPDAFVRVLDYFKEKEVRAVSEPPTEHHTIAGESYYDQFSYSVENEQDAAVEKARVDDLKVVLIYGALLFLRFKTPLFLLFTLLKNKVKGHYQLLRIWLGTTIVLDLAIVVYLEVGYGMITTNWVFANILSNFLFFIIPFISFRLIFWSLAKTVISELAVTESSLFPNIGIKGMFMYLGSNIQSTVKVLLTWEILINTIIFFTSISFFLIMRIYHGSANIWASCLPNIYGFQIVRWELSWLIICGILNIGLICITSIQLIAVEKGWNTCLKVLLPLYSLLGIVCPLVIQWLFFLEYYGIIYYFSASSGFMQFYFHIGLLTLLMTGQLILKIFLIVFTFKYLKMTRNDLSSGSELEEKESSLQPLLTKNDLQKELYIQ